MKLAIFDLDHTLLSINSSFHFGVHLYRKGLLSLKTLLVISCSSLYQNIFPLPLQQMHQLHFKRLFRGKEKVIFDREASVFTKKHLDKMIYTPAFERLKKLKKEGFQIVIMSGSPSFLVDPIATHLGADRVLSTEYAVDASGKFSHISKVMDGDDKALAVQQMAHPHDHIEAYSDSRLDLPLLKIADKAVGVNPDRKLLKICREKGWEVL